MVRALQMDGLYQQTLKNMEQTLHIFESRVPPPEFQKMGKWSVFRYKEKNIHQALIQKLARVVSGLHAARLLLANGFVQELAALQRMLDEFNEDITFLATGVINGDMTDSHQKYLDNFYQEEFGEDGKPLATSEPRPMVPRKKIRAYLARLKGPQVSESKQIETTTVLSKVYSGFVHGASPQIMDMYGGDPPRFAVSGMLGTPRIIHHSHDLWNYFYRGILSFAVVAKAFGDDDMCNEIRKYRDHFESVPRRR